MAAVAKKPILKLGDLVKSISHLISSLELLSKVQIKERTDSL